MKDNSMPWRKILFVIVSAAVIWFVWHNIERIAAFQFRFDWRYSALGFFSVLAAYFACFVIWRNVAKSFGLSAPILTEGSAWSLSQLGKYVPGKITLLLVRLDAYRGYSKRKVAIATGIEYVANLASACLLILVAFAFTYVPPFIRWFAVIGAIGFPLFLWPPFFSRIINGVFKIMHLEPVEVILSYKLVLRFIGAYTLCGLLHGLGLFFVLNSFSAVSVTYYLTITGAYCSAGLIGIAAIFAPAGLGVREGVLFLVLPAFIPQPTVIVGVITIRLIATFAEILLAVGFVTAKKYRGSVKEN